MAIKNLSDFLKLLSKRDDLIYIKEEVDPELEITEITDRVSKAYGKALYFENVKGSKYPLVINTLGTYERMYLGLGVQNFDEIADSIGDYLKLSQYASLSGKIKAIPKLAPLPFIFPKKVKKAPCQEVIEDPNLDTLPIIKCWPEDGGKYITLPLVFTKDPETNQQNCGMYRLQVYDHKTTGMHWHLHKDGKEIYEKYKKLGQKMPVSVALGCDPATIYSSTAPLPKMIDEMVFAGYLRKKSVEMVKCITNDLFVPANAEFILEGYVDLDELRLEGPFGDHTGYYSLADLYPVFHIEKITRRKNPIYPTTIVGQPPMEDCYIGKATERIFLPLLKIQCPEIIDMEFPLVGVFHNCAIISIEKKFPKHAQKLMYALWGLGQMMYTKMLIIVDSDVNIHDYTSVANAVFENFRPLDDAVLSEGPLDALDHSSNKAHEGFRIGIDATRKLSVEQSSSDLFFHTAHALEKTLSTPSSQDAVSRQNPLHHLSPKQHIFIHRIDKSALSTTGLAYLETLDKTISGLYIAVDSDVDATNISYVAWKVFNNIDPRRDISHTTKDNKVFTLIDATRKGKSDGLYRSWPNDIIMSDEIKKLVDEKWEKYGITI